MRRASIARLAWRVIDEKASETHTNFKTDVNDVSASGGEIPTGGVKRGQFENAPQNSLVSRGRREIMWLRVDR